MIRGIMIMIIYFASKIPSLCLSFYIAFCNSLSGLAFTLLAIRPCMSIGSDIGFNVNIFIYSQRLGRQKA